MPKYHYRCEKCAHEFEEVQRMTEDALTICPKCKASIYRVISSNIGVSFKGNGFHINDYKGENNLSSSPSTDTKKKPTAKKESKKKT